MPLSQLHMAEDEEDRSLEFTRNPMAYAFDPVRRERQVQLVGDLDELPLILSGVESVGNTAWCSCGHVTAISTRGESIC